MSPTKKPECGPFRTQELATPWLANKERIYQPAARFPATPPPITLTRRFTSCAKLFRIQYLTSSASQGLGGGQDKRIISLGEGRKP